MAMIPPSKPATRKTPRRALPVSAARALAHTYGMRQVIIVAVDDVGDYAHVTTYGNSVAECRLAAESGNNLKQHMGWPESTLKNFNDEVSQNLLLIKK